MRDTTRHVAPGRGALCRDQLGDVVERDDVAVARGLAGLFGTHPNRQVALVAVAQDRHLPLHQPLIALARGLQHLVEFGQHIRQRVVQRLRFGVPDQLFRRAVENTDAA